MLPKVSPVKGFFSLIQYCHDISRCEAANIGVILVVPELDYVDLKLSPLDERVERFFGPVDKDRLGVMKRALASRLREEAVRWKDPSDLDRFRSLEGNHLQLTKPRVVLVDSPMIDLEDLFQRLVV